MADAEDRKLWCQSCAYASTEPLCLFCGGPMLATSSGVKMYVARDVTEAELRAYQRQLAHRTERGNG